MIDIHCHILPQVDDGAGELEEAIGMAKVAAAEGITDIIATPHHANGKWMNEAGKVNDAVAELNRHLTAGGVPVTIHAGQEIRVYRDLMEDYHRGALLRLNQSPYLLIEFPSASVPSYIDSLLHEFRVEGITPVIAHPERNQELTSNPQRLVEFIEGGALCQVTSHSVNGLFGSKIQKLAIDWCRSNLIHFVASDAHNLRQRAFQLAAAYDKLGRELGEDYPAAYRRNAERLLQGDSIFVPEPALAAKKWFQFWR